MPEAPLERPDGQPQEDDDQENISDERYCQHGPPTEALQLQLRFACDELNEEMTRTEQWPGNGNR